MSTKKFICLMIFGFFSLLFLSLSSWQIYRAEWKKQIIRNLITQPIIINFSNSNELLKIQEYTAVIINGKLINSLSIHLFQTTSKYAVITPFKNDDGSYILVNQGTHKDKEYVPEENDKSIELLGRLQCKVNKPLLVNNNPELDDWVYIDPEEVGNHLGIKLSPCVVRLEKSPSQTLTSNPKIELHNNHIGYAITWFIMALATITMTMILLCKKDSQ